MIAAFASAALIYHRAKTPIVRISKLPKHVSPGNHQRVVIKANAQKPPPVKSSFYKNPSKAIEKGGGFYIPGLRGPRIRVFVATVALSLLSLNHVAFLQSSTSSPLSFTISEILALSAIAFIGASAVLDIKAEEEEIKSIDDISLDKSVALRTVAQDVLELENTVEEAMTWTAQVSMQMTGLDGFCIFQDDNLIFASGSIDQTQGRGPAVARVATEKKSLFIDDTKKLPPEISFPFLQNQGGDAWRVYMVPIMDGHAVVVFSGNIDISQGSSKIGLRNRAWLSGCASRIEVAMTKFKTPA